ncbi:MAG: glycosyltransferase family 2 protein [Flavobacteriales bacterium]|nr:glycosyltransferase family 2 protein [Flavobacteriales bacterium]
MKVTVLMTLYNKAAFVEEAARSVLNGSFQDFELLVVDDASTDDGVERLRALDDPRIRIIRNERNMGRAASANVGYAAAQGGYIAVLDADDVQEPDRLQVQVAFMDAHPEVGVCGGAARYFGTAEGVRSWPLTDAECRGRSLFTDPVLYGSCIMRCSVMMAHGLRSNDDWKLPAEDYLFLLTWSPHARFANVPEVVMRYRIGEQNQRHGRDPVADRAAVCKEAFRFFGIPLSEAELDVHMLFHQLPRTPVDRDLVRRFLAWETELIKRVEGLDLFPMDVFRAEVERRRKKAFHLIADSDLAAASLFIRSRGGVSMKDVSYLAKVTTKRWLGGQAKLD